MKNIEQVIQDLWSAWVEAKAQQAKYYRTHSHIE
jgi:hypothetical protein